MVSGLITERRMEMYGLNGRDEITEMRARYSAMTRVLSDILDCGIWDIETLFDSDNNIEVGEIIKRYVENCKRLPSWNTIYRWAMYDFASEYELEFERDVDIYANGCLDSHIYARGDLPEDIIEEMANLFNIGVEIFEED